MVFGANGRTGCLLVGQALAGGHEVVAVTRRKPIDLYSAGTANIVAAMTHHSLRRLAVAGTAAVDPGYRAAIRVGGPHAFGRVVTDTIQA